MIDGVNLGSSSLSLPKRASRKSGRVETTYELNQLDAESQAGATGYGFRSHEPHCRAPTVDGTVELAEETEISLIDEEDLEFPEGGFKAYLVVFGSFMGLIPVAGMFSSVGAIQAYVATHQLADVSSSTVSWIFSINMFVSFSSSIFSGAFFDKNGARPPILIGSVLFVGGLVATGNAQTVYQFILAFGVVNGLGFGMLMSPLMGVILHYFHKRRATVTSIATTGGSIGGIVFPMMLKSLYFKVGFSWALRILALVCLSCFTISLIFTKERIKSKREGEKMTIDIFLQDYVLNVFDYRALFEVKFVFCALAVALSESYLSVCSIYFPSYALMRGHSETTSYLLLTIINTTGILGRYIPGYISDKYLGRFNTAILTISGCVISSLLLWLPFGSSLKVLYAFASIYGFCSGSILTLSSVCCGQISRTDQFGKRYSTMYVVVSLAMLASIPIAGVIIGKGTLQDYNNFIIYATMLCVASICCYVASRHACVGFRLCKF